jgi:arylsulfatase
MHRFTRLLAPAALLLTAALGHAAATGRPAQDEPAPDGPAGGKPPYNILFVVCDQETCRLFARGDYRLPAREALQRRGVTFHNHYIGAAVCTPSRATFFTGTPPQKNGVFDQMSYGYVPNLRTDQPNMGSVLKGLGYKTAYFGKFEMNLNLLRAKKTDNTETALQPYGFDLFNPDGDTSGRPYQGFDADTYFAGEGVRWLRGNAPDLRKKGQPFFMVMSFLNPHDIMFADANPPGRPPVQKPIAKGVLTPPPASAIYERRWDFPLPPSLGESLKAPGMPSALFEYNKGWSDVFGVIPTDRKDMWQIYYNYYLNCIRDNDRSLQQIIDALTDLDLWKDTVVVFTADHGEMGGAHGGLRSKGPMCYEANAHVPLIIAHPDGKAGKGCTVLTSHIDMLPTFVGLTGLPAARRPAAIKGLPGRDFSALVADPEKADVHAIRPGALFNYVGLSTVDADFFVPAFVRLAQGKRGPDLTDIKLGKRGFLAFVFDGRYKLGRFYAPNDFNTPKTLDELFRHNDVQVFDLKTDLDEMRNLALDRKKNGDLILRLNGLLNDLMAREVGANDSSFLPAAVRPGKSPRTSDRRS